MRQRRWQLGWRASIGYGIVVVAVATAGSAAYKQLAAAREAGDQARHAQLVLGQVAEVEIALLDAETGQRGFLLTGEDAYLEPYERGRTAAPTSLALLRQLTADNPEQQQQQLGIVDELAATKLSELRQTVDLRRSGGADAALAVVRSNVGKDRMDRLRAALGEIASAEQASLELRIAERAGRFAWARRIGLGQQRAGACHRRSLDPAHEPRRAPTGANGAHTPRK